MKALDSAIPIRRMQPDDLVECQRLKEQLIWNQTLKDWQRFLSYNPAGCFVAEWEGKLVGTVCTIAYEDRFGWVAMVIVDPAHRRKGIGKALLNAGIQHLLGRGLTVKLDATPEGKLLYDSLGFAEEYSAARWMCDNPVLPKPGASCSPVTKNDWEAIISLDKAVFGASRRQVLESYFTAYPQYSYQCWVDGELQGYITAREGSKAFHPGPWVAQSDPAALDLLCMLLQKRRPLLVYIDALDQNIMLNRFLQQHGFTRQRQLIRMYLGENTHPGMPDNVYGLSGPELG